MKRYLPILFLFIFSILLFGGVSDTQAALCEWKEKKSDGIKPVCLSIDKLKSGELDLKKAVRLLSADNIKFKPSDNANNICQSICDENSARSDCAYNASKTTCPETIGNTPENYTGPLPDCAFSQRGCRDLNKLVEVGVNVTKILFSLMGSIAFIMFMYGGVLMISSFGNAEQFKKGRGVLVAAVIGIIISLSAYLVVEFILNALKISSEFRAL